MQKTNKLYFFIVGGVLLFLIGIYIGKVFTDIPLLELDKKVTFGEILNFILAIVTLTLAFYIAYILERKKKKEEYIFEFLTKKIDDLNDEVKNLIITISGGKIPIHVLNSKLKNVSMAFIDLKEVMALAEMNISTADNSEILALIRYIKVLCTENSMYKFGTNVIAYIDEKELIISDGKIEFTPERIDRVKVFSKKIINKVFYLIAK